MRSMTYGAGWRTRRRRKSKFGLWHGIGAGGVLVVLGILVLWATRGEPGPKQAPAQAQDATSASAPASGPSAPAPAAAASLENATGAPPACALIDVDHSPVAALLQAKLVGRPGRTWLERTEIDKLLAEQELQSLLGAAAGPGRMKLGQLLKADLLVFVRSGTREIERDGAKRSVPFAEIVVSETGRGLRLLARFLPLSDNAEQDAATLSTCVDEGIARHGQRIEEVCAVPPFLSRDLGYEREHLKAAYAALVERALLARPGIAVVELAEAEALGREAAVAGEGPSRRLPLYVLGEYRNEPKGPSVETTVRLTFKRGRDEVDSVSQAVPLEQVPEFLVRSTSKVRARSGGVAPPDPRAEAEQLARRAQEFLRLGMWGEALPLIESSLLLQPGQPDLRCDAVTALMMLRRDLGPLNTAEKTAAALKYEDRALDHLASFVGGAANENDLVRLLGDEDRVFLGVLGRLEKSEPGVATGDLQARRAALVRKRQETMTRIAAAFARRQDWIRSNFYLGCGIRDLDRGEQYTERLKMILAWQGSPNVPRMVEEFAQGGPGFQRLNTLEGKAFLEQLASAPAANTAVRAAAEAMKRELSGGAARPPSQPAEKAPLAEKQGKAAGSSRLTFRPVTLPWRVGAAKQGAFKELSGGLALPNRIDVFWDRRAVYLAKARGDIVQVWGLNSPNPDIPSVVYDGRFVWAAANPYQQAASLVVIDPQSEEVREIGVQDGLPLATPKDKPLPAWSHRFLLAPVAPGKVCVAGWFGYSWLALVTHNPTGRPQVDVFHEAKEVHDPRKRGAEPGPGVAFRPYYMATFGKEGDPAGQRILVGRNDLNDVISSCPLVVDPQRRTVEVCAQRLPGSPEDGDVRDGAMYQVEGIPPAWKSLALKRIAAPDFRPVPVIENVPEGRVVFLGERVNAVGKQWWTGRLGDRNLACAGDVPWYYRNGKAGSPPDRHTFTREDWQLTLIVPSNHYGFLTFCQNNVPAYRVDQVVFDDEIARTSPIEKALVFDDVKRPKQPAPSRPVANSSSGPSKAEFRPVTLRWRDANGEQGTMEDLGWGLALPNRIDVFSDGNLYLAKARGDITRVWRLDKADPIVSPLVFDGRYVWMAVSPRRQAPFLVVVDPESEEVWELGPKEIPPLVAAEDKPPQAPRHALLVAPIAPGKVCVAGGFGRSWLALVTHNPSGRPQVDVFHEARETPQQETPTTVPGTGVAFTPSYMMTLGTDKDPTGPRILVGRGPGIGEPLIVDPRRRTVEVCPHRPLAANRSYEVQDGAAYQVRTFPPNWKTFALSRVALPDFRPHPMIEHSGDGRVVFLGERLNVVGNQWWTGRCGDGRLTCVGDLPWCDLTLADLPRDRIPVKVAQWVLDSILPSNHYGILVSCRNNVPARRILQVVFDDAIARSNPIEKALVFEDVRPTKRKTANRNAIASQPQGTPAAPAQPRTWSDATGKFKIVATFLKLEGDQVALKREDGRTIEVPVEKLSEDDLKYLQAVAAGAAAGPLKELVAVVKAFHDDPGEAEFEAMETLLARLRRDRAMLSNGEVPLDLLYQLLSTPSDATDEGWKAHFEKIERWRKVRPESASPLIVKGRSYLNYGWQARGNGFAGTVSEEGWQRFGQRLKKAQEALEAAAKLARNDADPYCQLIHVAKARSADREEVNRLLAKAIAVDPKYYPLYEAMAEYLLPRWHGKPGEVQAFAREAAKKVGGEAGLMIYGRIACRTHVYEANDLEGFSIELLKQAAPVLGKRCPHSPMLVNFACLAAYAAGDREETARLAARVQKPFEEVWTEEEFQYARRFADPQWPQGKEKHVLWHGRSTGAFAVAWSSDGKTLASTSLSARHRVKLWDPQEGRLLAPLLPIDAPVTAAAFNARGDRLALGAGDRGSAVIVLPGRESAKPKVFAGPEGQVDAVAFSPDGKLLAAWSMEGALRVWDLESGKERLKVEKCRTGTLAFSPDGKLLVNDGDDRTLDAAGSVRLLDLETGDVRHRTEKCEQFLAFLADGAIAGYSPRSRSVLAWDCKTGSHRTLLKDVGPVVAFSEKTMRAVVLEPSKPVEGQPPLPGPMILWDVGAGRERAKLEGHLGAIRTAVFSPDGKTLASVSHDGSVRVWQTD